MRIAVILSLMCVTSFASEQVPGNQKGVPTLESLQESPEVTGAATEKMSEKKGVAKPKAKAPAAKPKPKSPSPSAPAVQEDIRVTRERIIQYRGTVIGAQFQKRLDRLEGKVSAQGKRLSRVEANPLGGTKGQRAMWKILNDANVASHEDVRVIARQVIAADKAASPRPPATAPATVTPPASSGAKTDSTPAIAVGEGSEPRMALAFWILIAVLSTLALVGIVVGCIAWARRGSLRATTNDFLRAIPEIVGLLETGAELEVGAKGPGVSIGLKATAATTREYSRPPTATAGTP